jgi:hypothetical protein
MVSIFGNNLERALAREALLLGLMLQGGDGEGKRESGGFLEGI